ncbi:MAG: HU family DNA-binding protein [Chitinophagales bacterium]
MKLINKTIEPTKHKEFLHLYAQKMDCSVEEAESYLYGFVETIYDLMKKKSSITIRNFGKFYIAEKRNSTIFKFNPSQKMKAIIGWSSGYKGKI